jgi:hypothetical protein
VASTTNQQQSNDQQKINTIFRLHFELNEQIFIHFYKKKYNKHI